MPILFALQNNVMYTFASLPQDFNQPMMSISSLFAAFLLRDASDKNSAYSALLPPAFE